MLGSRSVSFGGSTPATALSLAAVVLAVAGLAGAASTPSSKTISACVTKKSGALRVLAKGKKCRKRERSLKWNSKGIAGKIGPAGPAGPGGSAGDTGPAGAAGPAGSDAQFNGAAAGGDLTGAYPAPSISASAVDGSKVADNSLTGADITETSLNGVNASLLSGQGRDDYIPRLSGTAPDERNLRFASFRFDTQPSGTASYDISGSARLERTGVDGQLKVCVQASPATVYPVVVYHATTRVTASLDGTTECTSAITVGSSEEFRVYVDGTFAAGSPVGHTPGTIEVWQVMAFSDG